MKTKQSINTFVCVLAALLSMNDVFAERPRIYCIEGATLVPAPGEEISNGTIVIRDGLIDSVGAGITPPPDAVVIDGDGLWVYAGLIDPVAELIPSSGGNGPSHSGSSRGEAHTGGDKQGPVHPLALVHPEVRVSDSLVPFEGDLKRKAERMRELGFTTVLVVPPSGVFRGQSAAVLLLDDRSVSKIILKNDVAQHVGFDRGRFGSGYPTSLMGAAATIRQVLLDSERYALWHDRYTMNPQGMSRPEYVAAFDALSDAVSRTQPIVFDADSAEEVLLAYALADEFELEASIVGTGHEWEFLNQIRSRDRVLILPIDFPEKPEVGDDDEALEVSTRTMLRYLNAPGNPGKLHDAGIDFALTTNGLTTLSDFKKNIQKMIDEGLPESAVLSALTVVPARLLGIEGIAGTLEVGKSANVAVFDGPIFAEDSSPRQIFVDGIEFRIEDKKKPRGGDANAVVDPRGEWAVVFEMPGGGFERVWEFEGKSRSLTGTAETRDGIVNFEKVTLQGNMLTIVFPARGGRISTELTVVITGDALEGTADFGQRSVKVTGVRTRGPQGGER